MDGTVGELVSRTDISHFRPAHVHFVLTADGYEPLTTHLFQAGAEYLDSDVVFGTRERLVVPFEPRDGGALPDGQPVEGPWLEARYDFTLQPARPSVSG
jgi:hydroxyquinol 1,2-dioxygenase